MDDPTLGTFICLVLACVVKQACAGGKLELRLVRYDNPDGSAENGNYCDGLSFVKRSDCDQYFQVCVDWSSGSSPSMTDCDVGYVETGFVHNADSIDFGDVIGESPDSVETPNPLFFEFTSWDPAGIKVKVDVWDDDSSNDDEHVELLPHATMNIIPSFNASNAGVHPTEISGRTTLLVNVKAYCDDGFYGSRCAVFCRPHDDVTGHYTCGLDGRKQCRRGWTGVNCTVSVNRNTEREDVSYYSTTTQSDHTQGSVSYSTASITLLFASLVTYWTL